MSSGIDYLALFQGGGGGADPITALLAQGGVGGAGGAGAALAALGEAERNQTTDIAATAQQPQVRRTLARFQSAVARAKTPADLLADPDALGVLLTVNGLASQTSYTALAKKALLSDPGDPKSLASQLAGSNANWKAAAATYQFATKGLAVLRDPKTLANVARSYAEVSWRNSLDQTTPGLSNALDFRARIGTAKSVDDILGDATFRTVVTTALGIPPQIAYQGLEAQEKAISSRLDLSRLREPRFVESFTQRYLIAAQATAGTSGTSGGSSIESLAVQSGGLVV